MTLRIILRIDDAGMAANVGGAVHTEYKTFDISEPTIEAALKSEGSYQQRQIVGIEVLP